MHISEWKARRAKKKVKQGKNLSEDPKSHSHDLLIKSNKMPS